MSDRDPHFQFDAYGAYEHLKDRYVDFLLDAFGVRKGPLADRLREHWQARDGGFCLFRPLLVQGAFPFTPGKPFTDLESDLPEQDPSRPLHPKTVAILQQARFPSPLHKHQGESVLAGSTGRTVVLSAGTGSGKTEAFLVPLIDRLHWAEERGEDDLSQPGVRAIVVYPLNALVNNQVDRLRGLLGGQSRITFAYFTSRLHETYREAERFYEARGKGKPPACQIIDRRTLRGLDSQPGRPAGPPHILVTNFSMLEYMLIRPLDRTLFLPRHIFYNGKPRLRAIVLDEAHVYAGAQAAEIHMLLRRAAQRFGTALEHLQGFATSATLSRGGDENAEVEALTRFATGMFSKSTGQIAAIVGRRHLPAEEAPPRGRATALRVPAAAEDLVAANLRTLEYDAEGNPVRFVEDAAMATAAVRACSLLGIADEGDVAVLPEAVRKVPALLLHALLSSHPQIVALRRWLFDVEREGLPSIDEVADRLFGAADGVDARRRAADAILRLASLARREPAKLPYIPARMHAFLRSPTGVWVAARETPSAGQESSFAWATISSAPPSGERDGRSVLQLFTCSNCGAPYFEGWLSHDEWGNDTLSGIRPERASAPAVALVCDPAGDLAWPGGIGPKLRRVDVTVRVKASSEAVFETVQGARLSCEHCGDDQARLSPLRLGPRSALGAIVDAVYPYLNEHAASTRARLPGGGRRLLTFSDSRQLAARTAAEVENTHDIGVNRQLILQSLERAAPGGTMTVVELVQRIRDQYLALAERAPAHNANDEILEELAHVCVHQEFSRPPARGNTLETLGLVEVVYPDLPSRPAALAGITEGEWQDLFANVLDDVRRRGAVRELTLSKDARENHNLHELLPRAYLNKRLVWSTATPASEDDDDTEVGADAIGLLGADGTAGARQRIVQYVDRLRETMGAGAQSVEELLRHVWDTLWRAATERRCRWLKVVSADKNEQALRVDLQALELRLHESPPFIEPASGRVYFRSVRAIPLERGSKEALRPLTPEDHDRWRTSHPIRRILDEPFLGLHSAEHTAQIDVDSLEAQEGEFREGKLNLLASSTTMEMGIDLGGLTFVVLTNAPPGPANYWQRAGRAGRRADGSSAVLTLTSLMPHDQKVFSNPRAFLAQEVVPPRVRLDTEPLIARHANAFLLTAFFEKALDVDSRGDPMRAFGTLGDLAFQPARGGRGIRPGVADELGIDNEQSLSDAFLVWLGTLDAQSPLAPPLEGLLAGTALSGWTVAEVAQTCAEAFERSIRRARQDLEAIEAQRREENEKGEGSRDQSYLKSLMHQEKDLKHETTIAYLARTDFLPRFGFPVGLVYLETKWKPKRDQPDDDQRADKGDREPASAWPDLRMERALDLALSQYVPGAEVIAGKRIHRSAGLIRNWMNADDDGPMRRRFLLECVKCGVVEDRAAHLRKCPVCDTSTQSEEDFRKYEGDAAKQDKRRKKRGDDDGAPGAVARSSPVRSYWMPSSFAVQLGRPPRRVAGDPDRIPGARVRLALSADDAVREVIPGLLAAGFAPESRLFVRSEGYLRRGGASGFGYAICRVCGRAEPEEGFGAPPNAMKQHSRLRGGGRCPARPECHYSRNAVLGTSATVDALRIRLLGDLAPRGLTDEEAFYLTLAICVQQVAAERLGVDRRVIKSTLGTYRGADGSYGREVVLYDEAGSGMLAHVAEEAPDLVKFAVKLALDREESDFIQFDTQFLAIQGKLRLDLVREHFGDEGRRAQLREPDSILAHGARPLRGTGPRTAVARMLEDPNADVLLVTSRLSPDSFQKGGMLRAVQRAAMDGNPERLRVLLGRLPALLGSADEALLAGQLATLVRAGVMVRWTAELDSGPWRVLCRRRGRIEAIGGLDAAQGSLVPTSGEDFGPGWLERSVPVELASEADGATLLSMLDATWARARVVRPADLEPPKEDNVQFFPIRHGATDPASTEVRALLEKCLGPLADLGEVEALGYVDRYVARSLIAMYRLKQLLNVFRYTKGARAFVLHEGPLREPYPTTSAADLLSARRVPRNLSEPESEHMCKWVESSLKGRLAVDFCRPDPTDRVYLRHPRKLLVQFAPGGRLKTLKVAFEHGLDWVRPVPGSGPWTQRPMQADETHVVIIIDHRLEDERDVRGESEWTRYFGR